MSRPKPKIILSKKENNSFKIEEILEADGVYAVFYKGCPISIKWGSEYVDDMQPKYRKTFFPSAAHAHNLADRLNKKFQTTDFVVYKLENGTPLSKNE
jgi:hypothetical protein